MPRTRRPSPAAPNLADAPFISRQVREGDYYFLDLKPSPAAELAVVCGGREVCGAAYRIDRPGFHYFSLEYVAKGAGELVLGGRRHRLGPGAIFAYGPDIPHTITGGSDEAVMVKYFVDFSGRRAAELLKNSPLGRRRPLQAGEPARIQELFEDLRGTVRGGRPSAARLCTLLLETLILRAGDTARPYRTRDSLSWASYQKSRDYLEANYHALHELSDVARACRMSEEYLCRVFKRYHPCSPYQYLVQLKMAQAASLLLDRTRLVKEVAAKVGIEDPYHFSKVFKRAYGSSPEEFRASRCRV